MLPGRIAGLPQLFHELAHLNQQANSLSKAEYVKTVLGLTLTGLKVVCKGEGRWCAVDYANGITIRVSFYKIPDALVVVQVAPKLGPQREL
jgi:hypothetical protein